MIHAYLFVTQNNKVRFLSSLFQTQWVYFRQSQLRCFLLLPKIFNVCLTCSLSANKECLFDWQDHDAHGPEFLSHMYRVNKLTSANITV
jgi:hypothetical protein